MEVTKERSFTVLLFTGKLFWLQYTYASLWHGDIHSPLAPIVKESTKLNSMKQPCNRNV